MIQEVAEELEFCTKGYNANYRFMILIEEKLKTVKSKE